MLMIYTSTKVIQDVYYHERIDLFHTDECMIEAIRVEFLYSFSTSCLVEEDP